MASREDLRGARQGAMGAAEGGDSGGAQLRDVDGREGASASDTRFLERCCVWWAPAPLPEPDAVAGPDAGFAMGGTSKSLSAAGSHTCTVAPMRDAVPMAAAGADVDDAPAGSFFLCTPR